MAIDGPPQGAPVDVHLVLTRGSDPVRGHLLDADGGDVGFEGYMELIAAIQRVLAGSPLGHDEDHREKNPS